MTTYRITCLGLSETFPTLLPAAECWQRLVHALRPEYLPLLTVEQRQDDVVGFEPFDMQGTLDKMRALFAPADDRCDETGVRGTRCTHASGHHDDCAFA